MQIKDVEKLKQWLLKKLDPLCDADPAALAKYVVALLRKEKPKAALKELCIDQLEVFLAKETTNFVDQLFRGLESECYLKGADAKTPPTSPPSGLKPNPRSPCPSVTPSPPRDHTPIVNIDRKPSEDTRSKEVDDEDRDFRRSRKTGGAGGGGARESEGDPGRREEPSRGGDAKGKRNLRKVESEGPTTASGPTSASGGGRLHSRRGEQETSGGSGNVGPPGGGARRSIRDRLGPRPDDRGDSRGHRSWRDRRSRSRSRTPPRTRDHRSRSRSPPRTRDHRSRSRTPPRTRDHRSRSRSPRAGPDSGAEERGRKRVRRGEGGAVEGGLAKRRERCKNYDERGYCMLGEKCPFDHGVDPMVFGSGLPVPSYLPPPLPLGLPPPLPLGVPPLSIALALGKQGLSSSLPPPVPPAPPTLTGRVSPSSSTDGYNPEDPGLTATTAPSAPSPAPPSSSSAPSTFIPTPILPPTLPMRPAFLPHMPGIGVPPPPLPPFPPRPPFSHTLTSTYSSYPRLFPPGPRPPMRVPPSDTLIIRKIPRDLNSVTKLSGHFEKFGPIVNLTVRYEGDPESALVQFSRLADAKRAHGSTEAVLNNRFVRIYYLRKDMGPDLPISGPQGGDNMMGAEVHTPERMAVAVISETHGKAVNSTNSDHAHYDRTVQERTDQKTQALPPSTSTPTPPPPTLTKPPVSQAQSIITAVSTHQHHMPSHQHPSQQHPSHQRQQQPRQPQVSPEVVKKRLELQKMKQALLQKQIEEQKGLLAKLEKSGKQLSTEEKSQIMKALKVLSISTAKIKDTTATTTTPVTKVTTPTTKETTPTKPVTPTSPKPEIQIVGVGGALSTTSHLREKAEALRKQAHQLGLISSPSQPLPLATAGRGRGLQQSPPTLTTGRGRGQQQLHPQPGVGRGWGQQDLRVKLDHKPRQLLVINVDDREKLTQYFDSFGGLVQVEVDPENPRNLIYTFRNSFTAHKVVKSGSTLNGKPLIMKWYTPKVAPRLISPPPPAAPPSTLTSSASTNTQLQGSEHNYEEVPPATTPTLSKPDPAALHLVDDDEDDEESEGRSWRR